MQASALPASSAKHTRRWEFTVLGVRRMCSKEKSISTDWPASAMAPKTRRTRDSLPNFLTR